MTVRIAYVINSLEGGGASAPVPAITRIFRNLGAEVQLLALTCRDGRAIAAIEADKLSYEVRDGGETDHLRALWWLDRRVAAWRATHLWTSLTRATLLGQLVGMHRGLPVASWQHSAFLKPANRHLLRLMAGRSRLWIGDSQQVTDFTALRLNVPAERLMTWPIFAADPAAPVGQPQQASGPLRIGSLGRLHPVKGYDILIAALARLRSGGFVPPVPLEVIIAGEGHERSRLEAAVRAAGLEGVSFPGFANDPRSFLAGLNLYVQPSRSEGFCIAAHEALQAGVPAILSAVGEMPFTMIDGVMGRIVPPNDPEALAVALAELVTDRSRLYEMGLTARARVLDKFSRERFAAAGKVIFDRLCTSDAAVI